MYMHTYIYPGYGPAVGRVIIFFVYSAGTKSRRVWPRGRLLEHRRHSLHIALWFPAFLRSEKKILKSQ
jgi:hypothetical protein